MNSFNISTIKEEWAAFSGYEMQGISLAGPLCSATSESADLLVTHSSFSGGPSNGASHGYQCEDLQASIEVSRCCYLFSCQCHGTSSTQPISGHSIIDTDGSLLDNTLASLESMSQMSRMYTSFDREEYPPSWIPPLFQEADRSDYIGFMSSFEFTGVPEVTQDNDLSDLDIPHLAPWSQNSLSSSFSSSSTPSTQRRTDSIATSIRSSLVSLIVCSSQGCEKVFNTVVDLNHHLRYHNKPFQCPHCPLKQATKRLLNRHINERHILTEKYYCSFKGCPRSIEGDTGKGTPYFTREDNCKRHIRKVHGVPRNQGGTVRDAHDMGPVRVDCTVVFLDESPRLKRRKRRVGGTKLES